jgi:hypothetical protein
MLSQILVIVVYLFTALGIIITLHLAWQSIRSFGKFISQLGTYYFSAGGGENVSLSDVTYECYLCRTLAFDAVKFSPR